MLYSKRAYRISVLFFKFEIFVMKDKKQKFYFDFDIKNARELSPYSFFSDLAIFCFTNSYFNKYQIDFSQKNFKAEIISALKENNSLKYPNYHDINTKKQYQKTLFSILCNYISCSSNNLPFTIKNKFSSLNYIIKTQQKSLFSFRDFLIKRIEKMLIKQPIPKQFFPSYRSYDSIIFNMDMKNRKSCENNLKLIIDKISIEFIRLKNHIKCSHLKSYLIDINNILDIYPKSFSYSPILINSAIKKLDEILNSLFSTSDYEFSSEMINTKYHILLTKMRLHMMINQMHHFLSLLIQLLNMQEENIKIQRDKLYSINEIIPRILPKCTTSRSFIINDVSNDDVIDFCFSDDEKNDFLLTKNGIFQIVRNKKELTNDFIDDNKLNLIKIKNKKSEHYHTKENQYSSGDKIAYSNGILYYLNFNEKVIHKIKVSDDDELNELKLKNLKRIKRSRENMKETHYSKRKKGKPNPKKYKYSNKKLREKMKKNKRKSRKIEKYKVEKNVIDLDPIKIYLFDIPIISMGAYDNYIRIIQNISYDNGKTYLLFVNIDLTPDCRCNFDVEENFKQNKTSEKFIQTHENIIIDDKNQQIQNILFSCNYMFVFFDDSSIYQYIIFNNGEIELFKQIFSPLITFTNSILRMDNKMFLYYLEPIAYDYYNSVVISKMYFPETKHWLREENTLFLRYPYLKNLSTIVNNCSQFILNCDMNTTFTIDDNFGLNQTKKNSKKMMVSPEEMSSVVQSLDSIVSQLPILKDLILDIVDENLAIFFVVLLIKLSGINLFYELNQFNNDKNTINILESFKEFILDLYSSFSHSNSIEFDIILDESVILTIITCGKYLFYPNSFPELHDLMNQILCDNYNYYSKLLLKSFSSILFLYPSSLYFIDQSIYKKLIEFEDEIKISELFMKSIFFVLLEIKFSHQIKNDEFINFISPYIKTLFIHIKCIIMNRKIPFNIVKQIISYLLCYDLSNVFFSLTLQEELVAICSDLYKRIHTFSNVIENDKQFKNINDYIETQEVHKETKIFERINPYIDNTVKEDSKYIKITKIIDFDVNADTILVEFDRKCQFFKNDQILFYPKYCQNPIHFGGKDEIKFDSEYKFNTNFIKVVILIDNNNNNCQANEQNLKGYKIKFTGISTKNPFYFIPNSDLNFYNTLISFLIQLHCHSFNSIECNDFEKNLKGLLKDKIIQGIKIEDLYDDESPNFSSIVNGIDYDIVENMNYDIETKKNLLLDLINDDNQPLIQECIDLIYAKTSKQNKINLNNSTKSIFEIEHYFTACLLKQLGIISEFIDFTKIATEKTEIPNNILLIWKKIYELRKNIFYKYQKSKSGEISSESTYGKYLNDIKNKCIFLLCSYPIVMFKNNENLIINSINLIYSFIISKTKLSEISEFIENRQKRLSISSKSIDFLSQLIDQNILFESSKYTLLNFYNSKSPFSKCKGILEQKLNEYAELTCKVSIDLFHRYFNNKKNDLIFNSSFLFNISSLNKNDNSRIQYSKVIIKLLDKQVNNSQNAFILLNILFYLSFKTKNDELIQYIVSLFSRQEILNNELILNAMPLYIKIMPDNVHLIDENSVILILKNNKQNPMIIESMFHCIASIFNQNHDFIIKVLKGIGQSFTGKRCLFIDDSFQFFAHRQISESMIAFIRTLINNDNEVLFAIIHVILSNTFEINDENLEKDEIFILIGLFLSIGQTISSFDADRTITYNNYQNSKISISFYNPSLKQIHDKKEKIRNINYSFTNSVFINPKKLNLNEKEIQNLLNLNKSIINTKYFERNQNYEGKINQKEITENILVASFYSFLLIVLQNKNNVSIMFSKNYMKDTLLLFELSQYKIPSNENSIALLSHYLEQSILNPLYNSVIESKKLNSFGFIKMNYGDISYTDGKCVIKSNIDYFNIFACNRPINSDTKIYFALKIKKIGSKNLFIGIINSEDSDYNKAIGFGCLGNNNVFCRKLPYLSNNINIAADKSMEIEFQIKEGDSIGCYYTQDYLYFTLNGVLSKFRISHIYFKSYIPVIYIDHDDIGLEIIQNLSIANYDDKKFEFLNILNYKDEYFQANDIDSIVNIKNESINEDSSSFDIINQKQFLIGQFVKFNQMSSIESDIETNHLMPKNFNNFRDGFGIIKDIIPTKNKYVSKLKIESFNTKTLSKEIINFDIDSRYVSNLKTNFFNLIENRTETKFGFNSSFDLSHLHEKDPITSDLNSIKSYLRNKTIKDNSKSISIIMARYLVFILVDYLRYSKSTFLQEDGINSKESQIIIKSLACSLPTITIFNPEFELSINEDNMNDYLIFIEEKINTSQNISYKIPGLSSCFHYSFISFLKNAEKFLSSKFLSYLLQYLFEVINQRDPYQISLFYNMISSNYKIESLLPLPKHSNYKKVIEKSLFSNNGDENDIVGFIPLLLSTIPAQLPSVVCGKRRIRISSNDISYFAHFNFNQQFSLKWKCNTEKLNKTELVENYKMQFGIFILFNNLQEILLNGQLGFIQIIFTLIQSSINLDKNVIKIIYEKLFVMSHKKNSLVSPFLRDIIVYFISKGGFIDDILLTKSSVNFFSNLTLKRNLYQIDKFPSNRNEFQILFQIYSDLITSKEAEISISNHENKEELSILFEKYYELNSELFKMFNDENIDFIEEKNEKSYNKKKINNYRLFYLLFYYSILLRNENNLPYPMFIFVHEYIRQHFGGFSLIVDQKSIDDYAEDCQVDEILFHSDMQTNCFDLECSYKLINIYGNRKNDEEYKVFIHQNQNDTMIQLDEINKYIVSFPLDILIMNNESNERELNNGDFFIINFEPTKEQQKNYFISHYDEIEKAFHQFISLQKYENEITKVLFSSMDIEEKIDFNSDSFSSDEEIEEEIDTQNIEFQLNNESNDDDNDDDDFQTINNEVDNENDPNLNVNNYEQIVNDFEDDYLVNHEQIVNNSPSRTRLSDHLLLSRRNNNLIIPSFASGISLPSFNMIISEPIDIKYHKIFNINRKIPKNVSFKLQNELLSLDQKVISLRIFILSSYIAIMEKTMNNYNYNNCINKRKVSIWESSNSENTQNLYAEQIIMSIFSLSTEYKFLFIQKVILKHRFCESRLKLKINRFEQQKFIEMIDDNKIQLSPKPRPFLFQFMQQVDLNSLHQLINCKNPFFVTLVGENAVDAGGPGREIFSCLMTEMMNQHVGVFTFNPNRQHNIKETNQEDLIPFNKALCYDESFSDLFSKRFIYAGSLIAACIVSKLPQPIKLSSLIWEYLVYEKVTIESIYEIDSNFKKFIENAEKLLINSDELNDNEFESIFLHAFDINDSFDNIIELVSFGSQKIVTKENLKEFIQLSKNFRIHEFDQQLKDLKKGFNMVISYQNIMNILNPNELKLLICGEPNCDINQMKNLIKITFDDTNCDQEKIEKMFWNVIESFTVEERMMFIKFSSGNLGLPAPGLKWNEDIKVVIERKSDESKLAHSSTCSSTIKIPYFENEEELERILRISIENSGLITDSTENLEIVSNFL